MRNLLILIVILISLNLKAQDSPPRTDIYLLDLVVQKNNVQAISPELITSGNGYNNQPWFKTDDIIYFTSIKEDGQADIYSATIQPETYLGEEMVKYNRVTTTSDLKEYSAQITPDGKSISVVQVQPDDSTQWLVKMNADGSNMQRLLPMTNPVGYYTWIDNENVAAFVLGSPETLITGNAISGYTKIIASNIGRCIQKIPSSTCISYVDKSDSLKWNIIKYDPKTGLSEIIISCLPGSEDYAWSPEGFLLMGSDGKLYKYNSLNDKSWILVRDFNGTEVSDFYRLAVSPDGKKLAMVIFEGKKP